MAVAQFQLLAEGRAVRERVRLEPHPQPPELQILVVLVEAAAALDVNSRSPFSTHTFMPVSPPPQGIDSLEFLLWLSHTTL